MMSGEVYFVQFLRDAGLVTRTQLDALQHEAKRVGSSLYSALLASGYVDEDVARRAFAKSQHIPFVTLDAGSVSEDALRLLPEAFSRAYTAVAYKIEGQKVFIALLDLEDAQALEPLHLPYTVVLALTDRQSMKRALLAYQKILQESYTNRIAAIVGNITPQEGSSLVGEGATSAYVAQLVDALVEHALSQAASDVHLEPRAQGLLVRYRVGEHLHDALLLPAHMAASTLARLKTLAGLPQDASGMQEGVFSILSVGKHGSSQAHFRVLVLPTAAHALAEKMVLKISHESTGASGFMLESLGLYGEGLQATHRLLAKKNGLLLVCSPKGGGLSTLLYTLTDHLVSPWRSVATVEEVVECRLPGVSQVVCQSANTPTAIGALLNADTDVLMVAKLGTHESAYAAVQAANRGLFVVAGVEAASAVRGLAQVRGAHPEGLVASLLGVLTTTLVARLCKTHTKTKLSREEVSLLEARGVRFVNVLDALKKEGHVDQMAQWKDLSFGRPLLCGECSQGYVGFVGLQEVVPMTMQLHQAIVSGNEDAISSAVKQSGQLSLLEDGVCKAALGLTSIEEVLVGAL